MATQDIKSLRSVEKMSSSSVVATVIRAIKEAVHLFVGFDPLAWGVG